MLIVVEEMYNTCHSLSTPKLQTSPFHHYQNKYRQIKHPVFFNPFTPLCSNKGQHAPHAPQGQTAAFRSEVALAWTPGISHFPITYLLSVARRERHTR